MTINMFCCVESYAECSRYRSGGLDSCDHWEGSTCTVVEDKQTRRDPQKRLLRIMTKRAFIEIDHSLFYEEADAPADCCFALEVSILMTCLRTHSLKRTLSVYIPALLFFQVSCCMIAG
jgi:hypothetical protein